MNLQRRGGKVKPWDALLCASCRVQKAASSEWSERSGTCRFEFLPRNSGCRYGLPTICARVALEIKSGVKCEKSRSPEGAYRGSRTTLERYRDFRMTVHSRLTIAVTRFIMPVRYASCGQYWC
jgi:hypothetical protein